LPFLAKSVNIGTEVCMKNLVEFRAWFGGCGLVGWILIWGLGTSVMAQSVDEEISPEPGPVLEEPAIVESPRTRWAESQEMKEERARLLNVLKTEAEPNLMEKDIQRLKRNVMRLGSFRSYWSLEAKDFLVGNAPLAELYLYDYSRIQNERLNTQIIDTLVRFTSFKFPTAPMAFASSLMANEGGAENLIRVFERIVEMEPRAAQDIFGFVFGSWGRDLPGASKFYFALKSCEAGYRAAGSQIDALGAGQEDSLWADVLVTELHACAEGA